MLVFGGVDCKKSYHVKNQKMEKKQVVYKKRSVCVFFPGLFFCAWIFLFKVYFWHRSIAEQRTEQKEVLHNELLETWDERGLPLENFNVALPK